MHALFTERFIRGQHTLNETALFVATLAAFHVGIPEDGHPLSAGVHRSGVAS